jgi:demethylmenaquinone methyltransferase/2-methoxy-6-polyprenyl-1,4-benzoquinol methylase
MIPAQHRWFDSDRRRRQFSGIEGRDRPFYFGFERVTAEQKTVRVRRHFDSVAHCYDVMNTVLSAGVHRLWKRAAVRWVGLQPGQVVLDLCGGTGDLALLAAKAVGPGGRVVLADVNRKMITAGRNRFAGRPIAAVQCDAEALCLANACMDAAMVGFGIRNVTRIEKALQEIHRVLKPGGCFMCLEFSRPSNPFFCALYDFYSFFIMPLIGRLLVGLPQAYAHLPESIRSFAMPEEFAGLLGQAGFTRCCWRPLTNGMAVVHLARKR